jgi:hypothetical protein
MSMLPRVTHSTHDGSVWCAAGDACGVLGAAPASLACLAATALTVSSTAWPSPTQLISLQVEVGVSPTQVRYPNCAQLVLRLHIEPRSPAMLRAGPLQVEIPNATGWRMWHTHLSNTSGALLAAGR